MLLLFAVLVNKQKTKPSHKKHYSLCDVIADAASTDVSVREALGVPCGR